MSENPGHWLLTPVGDLIQQMLSRPSSPAPSESWEVLSTHHNGGLRTENYGLFTFGDERPPGNYNIELSILPGSV